VAGKLPLPHYVSLKIFENQGRDFSVVPERKFYLDQ